MSRARLWILGLVVVAALVGAGTYAALRHSGPPPPRLVLLYAPCTVNRAYLSAYNPQVTYTPALDAFARQGVVFTDHYTEEGQSGIAYASLFSGNQAMRHGVYKNAMSIADSVYLIGEAFHDHGYDTYFWADHPMASPELNFGQGFSPEHTFWTKRGKWTPPKDTFLHAGDERFAEILAHLKRDPSYKALVVTNFTVTHSPYRDEHIDAFCEAYPQECAGLTVDERHRYIEMFRKNALGWSNLYEVTVENLKLSPEDAAKVVRTIELAYKSNVYYLDQLFGALLEQIKASGLLGESLIAFTTDHGEVIYRPAGGLHWTHGYMLTPEDIVIPWIVYSPHLPAGRFAAITRSIDVLPTLAGLSGFQLPADASMGVDLAPALTGAAPAPVLPAYIHTSLPVAGQMNPFFPLVSTRFPREDPAVMWVGVRDGDLTFKLTSEDGSNFQPHAYDWKNDPEEKTDRYDEHNPAHIAAVQRLAQYKTALIEGHSYWKALAEGRLPTERQEELLRSLGYLK